MSPEGKKFLETAVIGRDGRIEWPAYIRYFWLPDQQRHLLRIVEMSQ